MQFYWQREGYFNGIEKRFLLLNANQIKYAGITCGRSTQQQYQTIKIPH